MLTIHIEADSVHSYKLSGEHLSEYHEQALEDAKDLYLEFYDEVYQNLMEKDFNPLWTPDTKTENDIDFKDDFWSVSYFLFNVCLLKNLQQEYEIQIVDKTKSPFKVEKYLYDFLEQEGIFLQKMYKKDRLINKNAIKKFVLRTLRSIPEKIRNIPDEYKRRFLLKKQSLPAQTGSKKTLYLFVEPVGNMDFVNWRYSKVLEEYREKGHEIVLVSTIDFKNSGQIDVPLINVNRLVSKGELARAFLRSVFLKMKVRRYILRESLKPLNTVQFKYFLKNVPHSLFYPIRENLGFNNLFKMKGAGLLVIKGPVINKSGAIQIYNARKHGIRTLVIAGRILTSTRLSNQFVRSHFDESYPAVPPHAMVVDDQISFETIQNQTGEIELYPLEKNHESPDEIVQNERVPFRITLALQKKKEIEAMVDEVVAAMEGMNGVVLNLKMHPIFPIYDRLLKRYKKIPFINILPISTPLGDAINNSDLCITAYSTAALEFAIKGKPIIWLKNVTFNRLFLAELQKKIGIVTEDSDELREVILKMKDDPAFYNTQKELQRSQLNDIIYTAEAGTYTLSEILDKELEKI